MNVSRLVSVAVDGSNLRVIRTQYGAVPAPPLVCVVIPPAVTRRWNANPLPGLTNIAACCEFAVSAARIMTPLFTHGSTFSSDLTNAVIVPSPLSVRYTNRNSSAPFQMSAPEPSMVKTPLL